MNAGQIITAWAGAVVSVIGTAGAVAVAIIHALKAKAGGNGG